MIALGVDCCRATGEVEGVPQRSFLYAAGRARKACRHACADGGREGSSSRTCRRLSSAGGSHAGGNPVLSTCRLFSLGSPLIAVRPETAIVDPQRPRTHRCAISRTLRTRSVDAGHASAPHRGIAGHAARAKPSLPNPLSIRRHYESACRERPRPDPSPRCMARAVG